MSSQKQSMRIHSAEREMQKKIGNIVARLMWLERRPPWWRILAVLRWKREEPANLDWFWEERYGH